jgi:hemin uptake protein HemP
MPEKSRPNDRGAPAQRHPTDRSVAASPQKLGVACVRSDILLGNERELIIEHAGMYYRLRVTRANKLILTK